VSFQIVILCQSRHITKRLSEEVAGGKTFDMLKRTDWLLDPHACPGFQKHEVVDHLEQSGLIHHTEHLTVKIPQRYALVNIQEKVEEAIQRSGVRDGFCFVSAMHITAGVYVNDAESGLLQDIAAWIENLAPFGENYLHHQTGEDNGDAHPKSYLTNHALTAPVTRGKLDFGTWQQIFYAEFDGRRNKRILLKITGIAESSGRR
jgi:secondary thiamine-phosphate synthase enzyme